MKYEVIGYMNGVELKNPVAENEYEKSELEVNEERFMDYLIDIIKRIARSSNYGSDREPNDIIEKS